MGDYIYGLEPTCLFLECSVRRCTSISLFLAFGFVTAFVFRLCTGVVRVSNYQATADGGVSFDNLLPSVTCGSNGGVWT